MEVDEIVKKLSGLSNLISECKFKKEDEPSWRDTTKKLYDFIKLEEKDLNFLTSQNTLPKLHINKMNSEQVWQQLEIQNDALIPGYESKLAMSTSNLCVKVAKLSSEAQKEEGVEETVASEDEGVETGEEELDTKTSDLGDELSEDDLDDEPLEQQESGDSEQNQEEDEFSDLDLDADTFGDIAMEDKSEEDSDNDEEGSFENQKKETKLPSDSSFSKRFKRTAVDTQFLSVRESEWVADNDLLAVDENDDVDLMAEEEDESEEEAQNAMYGAFFDAPSLDEKETLPITEDDSHSEAEDEQDTNKTKRSKFDESIDRQVQLQENLEDSIYLTERPWVLKGEVGKEDRPENSALEEPLEYSIAVRQKPIITEETTKQIERLLLSRIRTQAWDDVERRIKPTLDPFRFKQKLILDQEKSKKSLAAIYEEEFLRQNTQEATTSGQILSTSTTEKPEEELPIHKEIREEMNDLFEKLDALSNYHYTPRMRDAEIKVVSNLPSIAVEESTPIIASDATLLAPQEVVQPLKGELKGDTEKTVTDKSRERKAKKKHQRLKAQREELKLRNQLKTKSKDGLMKTDTSVKLVEKAFKKGQVKTLEGESSSFKSSTGFFNQLQNNVTSQQKKRKADSLNTSGKNKKKRPTSDSISKLLL